MEHKQKGGQGDRRANRVILRRTVALMLTFGVVMFLPLFYKLWEIQIVKHEEYEEGALGQQTRDVTVDANRGTIFDRNGTPLAISATAYNIIVSPRDLIEVQKNYPDLVEKARKAGKETWPEPSNELVATGLAELLGLDAAAVLKRLEKVNSQYEEIAVRVEEEQANAVRQFIVDRRLSNGVVVMPDSKRYYPYSSLAAQIIGFVNYENHGAYGLEAVYDETLSGESGRVITAKNGKGTEMLSSYENYIDALDGYNLNLTIDNTIQYFAERILQEGIDRYEVRKGGFCIVMNPSTGAIYAMASSPNYDLNNPRAILDEETAALLEAMKNDPDTAEEAYLDALTGAQFTQWRNKALNDTYEPGSTFKAMVLAAALEEGAVDENTTFYCSGSVKIAGHTINCHKHGGHGSQTLREAVMNSCNPAFITIGQRLGAERFYDYLEDFGLIGTTGIDLPEASNAGGSLVWSREYFTSEEGIASLATASFGQRLQVTPIQLITAAAATVNGGHLVEPYVVESVTDRNGNVIESHGVQEVRQVVSEQTSALVRSILESVVGDGGTGKNAYEAGYRIGGKTGTSETLVKGENIVSFLGFAPADNPQVIILLGYDAPKPASPGSDYTSGRIFISGGNMGAPMAGMLLADILDYLGVARQYTQEELSGADTQVPRVTGESAQQAQSLLKSSGLAWRIVGTGGTVTDQIPAAGASIPKGSQVVLYLGEEKPTDLVAVPDLVGKSPEAVQTALAELGLYLRATGVSGYFSSETVAVSQVLPTGTEVARGTVVEVRFVDGQVRDYQAN